MKAQETSEYGVRNIWCFKYSFCLDACIVAGEDGFSCQGCEHEQDLSTKPKDSTDLQEDCLGCMELLLAAYQDITPSMARIRCHTL